MGDQGQEREISGGESDSSKEESGAKPQQSEIEVDKELGALCELLRKLRSATESKQGLISIAAITVPSYFTQDEKKTIEEVSKVVGFRCVCVPEPIASTHAFQLETNLSQSGGNAFVFHMGSNSLNLSVIEGKPEMAIKANRVIENLGGENIDEIISQKSLHYLHFIRKISPDEDAQIIEEIREQCIEAKHQLSFCHEA